MQSGAQELALSHPICRYYQHQIEFNLILAERLLQRSYSSSTKSRSLKSNRVRLSAQTLQSSGNSAPTLVRTRSNRKPKATAPSDEGWIPLLAVPEQLLFKGKRIQMSLPNARAGPFSSGKAIVALQFPADYEPPVESTPAPPPQTAEGQTPAPKVMTHAQAGVFKTAYLCSTRPLSSTLQVPAVEVVLEEQVHIDLVRRKPRGPWIHQATIQAQAQASSSNIPPSTEAEASAMTEETSKQSVAAVPNDAATAPSATVPAPEPSAAPLSAEAAEFEAQARNILDEIIISFKAMLEAKPEWEQRPEAAYILEHAETPGKEKPIDLCLLSGNLIQVVQTPSLYQNLLEEHEPLKQARFIADMLTAQRNMFEIQRSTVTKAEESVKQEDIWREMLKNAEFHAGLSDREKEIERYTKRMVDKVISPEVQGVINESLQNLRSEREEYQNLANYLDHLTKLPWGVHSKDTIDINFAQKVLDEEHYGLKNVKEKILEFIAVGLLTKRLQGKTLCFVGPPGTGKTAAGESIARALNRKYARIALGAMTDIHEMKGFKRTYVASMPGFIIRALESVEVANPVILLDEIDKIGTIKGNASAALLEILDPTQNHEFMDSYLAVPFDLSKVTFVATANYINDIPRPLLDRLEVIQFEGYVDDEKFQIAQQYLIPAALKRTYLSTNQVQISNSAIEYIVRNYSREPGVRQLKEQIDKMVDKILLQIARKEVTSVAVSHKNVVTLLGPPLYKTPSHASMNPGITCALHQPEVLYIESSRRRRLDPPSKKDSASESASDLVTTEDSSVDITGRVDAVMKESSLIAFTYARNLLHSVAPSNRFFETWTLHMHVPAGSVEKTGSHTGVAMVTAMLSLAMDKPIRRDIVIAGEISLTGKIIPLEELQKGHVLSAKRFGAKTLILPLANKVDWDELDSALKSGLTAQFVEWYHEVFAHIFGDTKAAPTPAAAAATVVAKATSPQPKLQQTAV